MITTIPVGKLVASARNVRRGSDEKADHELKADIAARGLLQNLVVSKARKPRGCYAVEAGERRRRALQALVADGALAADHAVTCLVVDAADAREASLAENVQRLAMNPADACLAFAALIEQGADVAGVARRFGLTERFVEGRLRLAGLATAVFEALGAGTISLDVAKAYAATSDRERQAWVYEQLAGYGTQHPDSVRRMMTQATVSASDRRARLVGEEAYLAAGGRIERDLFAADGDDRWLDVALLERLASERMAILAEEAQVESGLAFVRPTLETWIGYGRLDGLRRVTIEIPALTEDEQAAVDALQAEIDGLADLVEDEEADADAQEAAEARIAELGARIVALEDKRPVLGDELKAQVGTFLLLREDGVPVLDPGYYAEIVEDAAPALDGNGAQASDSSGSCAVGKRERKNAGLPQRLVDELAIQRRDVLALHLATDPALALDLAVFLMVDSATAGTWNERGGFSLMAVPPTNPLVGFRTPDAPATKGLGQIGEALDRSWTKHETRGARFDAFRALPDAARAAWCGLLVAGTLEASCKVPGSRACAFHDHLGQVLGIEVARWWRPTGANYFDRVPKAMALAAMSEVGAAELAARHAKSRKAELAEACERLFAGELVVAAEVRAAALAWVPEAMRFAEPEAPDEVAEEAREGASAPDRTAATDGNEGVESEGVVESSDADPGQADDTTGKAESVPAPDPDPASEPVAEQDAPPFEEAA